MSAKSGGRNSIPSPWLDRPRTWTKAAGEVGSRMEPSPNGPYVCGDAGGDVEGDGALGAAAGEAQLPQLARPACLPSCKLSQSSNRGLVSSPTDGCIRSSSKRPLSAAQKASTSRLTPVGLPFWIPHLHLQCEAMGECAPRAPRGWRGGRR